MKESITTKEEISLFLSLSFWREGGREEGSFESHRKSERKEVKKRKSYLFSWKGIGLIEIGAGFLCKCHPSYILTCLHLCLVWPVNLELKVSNELTFSFSTVINLYMTIWSLCSDRG
jgi:hypothetical protein